MIAVYNLSIENSERLKFGVKLKHIQQAGTPTDNLRLTLNEIEAENLLKNVSPKPEVPSYVITEKGNEFIKNKGADSIKHNSVTFNVTIKNDYRGSHFIEINDSRIDIRILEKKFVECINESTAPPEEKKAAIEQVGALIKNPWVVQAAFKLFEWAQSVNASAG